MHRLLRKQKSLNNMSELFVDQQETSKSIGLAPIAETGELSPFSAEILGRVHFFGEPLLVSGSTPDIPANPYSRNGVPAKQYIAYPADSQSMVTGHGKRNTRLLQFGKMALAKAYEKPKPTVTEQMVLQKAPLARPQYQSFSQSAVELPTFSDRRNPISGSGFFTTPISSPMKPIFELEAPQGKPEQNASTQHKVFRAYPGVTLAKESMVNTSTEYKAYQTLPSQAPPTVAQVPILTASMQDTDYTFVDLVSPEPSPAKSVSSSSEDRHSRRFSFEHGAPDDSVIIEQSYHCSHQNARATNENRYLGSFLDLDSDSDDDEDENMSPISPPSPLPEHHTHLVTDSPRSYYALPSMQNSPLSSTVRDGPSPLLTTKSTPESSPPASPVPVPPPTTRYYPMAFAASGGRSSLRYRGPHGTIKNPHHSKILGSKVANPNQSDEMEMTEYAHMNKHEENHKPAVDVFEKIRREIPGCIPH